MATIKDVAKAAGVSVTTVSIVINGKAEERAISEATINKIHKAMRELGYQPNLSARRLRTSEKPVPVIAFFWPLDFRVNILASFLNAFSREIEESGFDCELVVRTYESDHLDRYDTNIIKNGYNAIIIGACSEKDELHLEKLKPQMPILLINRQSEKYNTVGTDNDEVGRLAAEAFKKKGYKEAAVFASNSGYIASNRRVNAFVENCKKSGIKVKKADIFRGESTAEAGYGMGMNFCRTNKKPKAIFCDSDAIAFGAVKAFNGNNIKFNEEVELITVDMTLLDITVYSSPSLSVVEMPNEEIGRAAIRLLKDKIANSSIEPEHIVLSPKLILRESFK